MTQWNPDCKGPCDCPGEEVELIAMAPVATEPEKVWRCGYCGSTRWVSVSLNQGLTRSAQCVPCGWVGPLPVATEPRATEPLGEQILLPSGPPASREEHLAQLAHVWDWGYGAAEQDALNRPYSDRPEAASWTPTPNPYRAKVDCTEHKPVQHRDAKRPWCNTCGRAADGVLIGKSKLL